MKEKLNILIIPSWYPSEMDPNGVPFIRAQAQALVRAGHTVTVVFSQAYSLKTVAKQKRLMFGDRENTVEGVKEIHSYFPKTHFRRVDEVTRLLQGKRLLKKWTRKQGTPDIVHVHTYLAGELGVWYHKRYRVPVVTTEHYTGFARGIVKPWEMKRAQNLYAFSSLNLAVSGAFASLLREKTGASFETLPNMVNTERFYPAVKKEQKPFTWLFVGSLHSKKNPEMLLEAFIDEYKKDDSQRLILAGEGELTNSLKTRAREAGVSQAVTFPGFLQGEEVAEVMRTADAFILPSRFETFGIVVIEAMATGIPVIVSRSGGPESFVLEGENGFIIDQEKEQLSKAMASLKKREWDKEVIRNYVTERFSEKAVTSCLVSLYRELLEKPEVFQASREISVSGGISKVAYQLALQLTDRGYRVSTLTTEMDELSLKSSMGRTVVLPVPRWIQKLPGYFNNFFKTWYFTRKVHSFYKYKNRNPHTVTISHRDSYGADIAVGHSCHREAVEIKKREGRRLWWLNPIHPFYLKEEKRIFRKPWPALAAISRAIAGEYKKHYKIPGEKVFTIANGVDLERFHPGSRSENRENLVKEFSLPENAFVLLFVGNEFKRKGLDFILDAMAGGGKELYLFVLGGADKTAYVKKAEELGIASRVIFTGRRSDAPLFFASADLFILPANYEPFGLVGVEALSSGTPILAPRLGGFLDYLKDGENGFFIEREALDILKKVQRIQKDLELWKSLSHNARETALEFSWEQIGLEYAALVDSVFKKKNS